MTRFTFDSSSLYTTLISAQAQMTDEIKWRTGDPDLKIKIIFWGGEHSKEWELCVQERYCTERLNVKGKHLEQCFEEALRRLGFAQQQESLLLTHEVEANDSQETDRNPQPAPAADDEIPF